MLRQHGRVVHDGMGKNLEEFRRIFLKTAFKKTFRS
jgi:hypothetical protein